jgi:hypothetical protein
LRALGSMAVVPSSGRPRSLSCVPRILARTPATLQKMRKCLQTKWLCAKFKSY